MSDQFAADGDLDVVDDGTWWQIEEVGEGDSGFEIDVVNYSRGGVVEMPVLIEVRAIAR